jgi:hypothetical protein
MAYSLFHIRSLFSPVGAERRLAQLKKNLIPEKARARVARAGRGGGRGVCVQQRAAKQQEVVQARAACSKKRAVAKILNIEINWSYKQDRLKQQWDKPLS